MKWGRHSGPRGYHHGNLKEALVRAALDLIAEKGPAGFTFADAARWAGVSPAAPYRHFRDRDELMTDVARRGFEQFSAALASAWDEGKPDLFSAFDRLGKAYLSFAKREPAYYSAMFEAGVPLDADPQLREVSERAFAVLRAAAEKLVALMPAKGRPPALMVALACVELHARHRLAVFARRCGAARSADAAGGTVGGGDPDLSARSRAAGWRRRGARLSRHPFASAQRASYVMNVKGLDIRLGPTLLM